MTLVITNNITMTTIEKYIISVINRIKSKKQRADESSISDYILKNFQLSASKSNIVERIEILLKNNTIINKQFNGTTSYKINEKKTTYHDHGDLQRTNDSKNNTDNASDSNVNNNLQFLNSPTSPMQVTTPLLTTKHCNFQIVALRGQPERQNMENTSSKGIL